MSLIDEHYRDPIVYSGNRNKNVLELDECIVVSKEFTKFLINMLHGAELKIGAWEGIIAGNLIGNRSHYSKQYYLMTGQYIIASAPESASLKYSLEHNNYYMYDSIFTAMTMKLTGSSSVNDKVKYCKLNRNAEKLKNDLFGNKKSIEDIQFSRTTKLNKYDIPFDRLFLESKFRVVLEDNRVYIFYGDDPCFVMMNNWTRTIPQNFLKQNGFSRYNFYSLTKGLADLIVKILNTR
jgi:hypothetical protein